MSFWTGLSQVINKTTDVVNSSKPLIEATRNAIEAAKAPIGIKNNTAMGNGIFQATQVGIKPEEIATQNKLAESPSLSPTIVIIFVLAFLFLTKK